MSIFRVCDVCGQETALDLTRHLPVMLSGRRVLIAMRVSADEGEKEPRPIDIGIVCLKKAIAGLTIIT